MQVTDVSLNNGTTIPQLGLGVYKALNGDETRAVTHALHVGYRHIDTAAIYHNEEGVGRGIRQAGVARDQVYLTSKIWNEDIRHGRTTEALDESLKRLATDYLDLALLHWPVDGRLVAWQDLISAYDAGKVRSIGVSNFTAEHIEELIDATGVVPALNQIEFHPYLTQPSISETCRQHRIAVEAWSPLMQGKFLKESLFRELSEDYRRTQAQIILRWDIQRGVITIPKSITPERIEENFHIFDFTLNEEDMSRIDALERNLRFGPDPENFDF